MDDDDIRGPSEGTAPLSAQTDAGGPQIKVKLVASPDGAAFAAWKNYLGFISSAELVDPAALAAFSADVEIFVMPPFILSDASASHAQRLVRTAEDIAKTAVDHVNIYLHLDGTFEGRCGSRSFLAQAGDVSFLDYGLPFELEVSAFRAVALTAPRHIFHEGLQTRDLGGLVPPASRAATRLLAQTLRAFWELLPGLTAAEAVAGARGVLDLADAASRFHRNNEHKPQRGARLTLYDRARAEIERGLGRDDLSIEAIAAALGISRSALYRLFEDQGGVQAYIRERRLWRCYEIINLDQRPDDPIGAISAAFGFSSEAHFSRSFKARFGMTPRDMRTIGRRRRVHVQPSRTGGVPFEYLPPDR